MTEGISELDGRIWVIAFRIIFDDEVKETSYVIFVDELAERTFRHFTMVTLYISRPGAEEFLEVECRVFYILKSCKGFSEVKGEDIETR